MDSPGKQGVILVGGLGTRLRSVIRDVPKPMALINGEPFLSILLKRLSKKGFNKIVLAVGYMSEVIQDYYGDTFNDIQIKYSVEKELLGTGGAIKQALSYVSSEWVFILNGDTYLEVDYDEVIRNSFETGLPFIVGCEVENTDRYGEIKYHKSKIKKFSEKQTSGSGIINGGVYYVQRDLLDNFDFENKFSFEQDYLAKDGNFKRFGLYITNGKFIDIGIPEDLISAKTVLDGID